MASEGVWLPGRITDRPLAAWCTEPEVPSEFGVVVLPPIGYASSSSYRFWRTLAERLAAGGVTVLRVDYPATGDSAGDAVELDGLGPWRSALPVAVRALQARGVTTVVVVGAQLGATFALLDGPALGVAGIVTIAPVLSGRRWVRALRLLAIAVPGGGLSLAGHQFTAPVLAELDGMRAGTPADVPVLAVPEQDATAAMLLRPAEEATVDPDLVDQIARWVLARDPRPAGTRRREPGPPLASGSTAAFAHAGQRICEEFVTVGPDALTGVLTRGPDSGRDLYVLVNSGSDPHTGPGRAWVELARELALRGFVSLRLDLRGWGESPESPRGGPGRPYDQHGVGDLARLVTAIRADWGHIVLGGLCAGAWISMSAARQAPVDGLVVLNPQLYWQPGDPVEARLDTTHERRLAEIAAIRAQQQRWELDDERGVRPPAARMLDDLVTRTVPCSMLFAGGDDGLGYLRERLGRRLREVTASGFVRVVELPDVDHAMHRTWLRPALFDTVAMELERVLAFS